MLALARPPPPSIGSERLRPNAINSRGRRSFARRQLPARGSLAQWRRPRARAGPNFACGRNITRRQVRRLLREQLGGRARRLEGARAVEPSSRGESARLIDSARELARSIGRRAAAEGVARGERAELSRVELRRVEASWPAANPAAAAPIDLRSPNRPSGSRRRPSIEFRLTNLTAIFAPPPPPPRAAESEPPKPRSGRPLAARWPALRAQQVGRS